MPSTRRKAASNTVSAMVATRIFDKISPPKITVITPKRSLKMNPPKSCDPNE